MNIDYREYLNLLCCVECHCGIHYDNDNSLLCRRCNKRYTFINGIPNFLSEEETNYWINVFSNKARTETDDTKMVKYSSHKSFLRTQHCISNLLGEIENKTVADIGCGNGLMTKYLAHNNTVIGLDFSKDMLMKARQNGLIPVLSNAMKSCLAQGSYDVVICTEALQYIEDLKGFVLNLAALLKKDGILIATGLNYHSILRRGFRFFHKFFHEIDPAKPREILHKPEECIKALRGEDTYDIEVFYSYHPLAFYKKSISKNISYIGSNFIFRITRK